MASVLAQGRFACAAAQAWLADGGRLNTEEAFLQHYEVFTALLHTKTHEEVSGEIDDAGTLVYLCQMKEALSQFRKMFGALGPLVCQQFADLYAQVGRTVFILQYEVDRLNRKKEVEDAEASPIAFRCDAAAITVFAEERERATTKARAQGRAEGIKEAIDVASLALTVNQHWLVQQAITEIVNELRKRFDQYVQTTIIS